MKKTLKTIGGIVIPFIITIILGEVGIRMFVKLPPIFYEHKTPFFRYDKDFGWFPIENKKNTFHAFLSTQLINNSDGFRDIEHDPKSEKPAIAFLGDSFVWGYDVEQTERVTEVVQSYLPEWKIFNMGVSGYGTDQEYLILKKFFPKYNPGIVVLVVHSNDDKDNSTNIRWHYRKPYYELIGDSLHLKGQPVPSSLNYQASESPTLYKSHLVQGLTFLYNKATNSSHFEGTTITNELINEFHKYLTSQGSKLLVVFTYSENSYNAGYLKKKKIEFMFAPTHLKFRTHGHHWTTEGHEFVGKKTIKRLQDLGWVKTTYNYEQTQENIP